MALGEGLDLVLEVATAGGDAEGAPEQLPALTDHGVLSSLTVVVPGQTRPFGCLGVDVTAIRMFSDEEICFLQAVANVLALAIERFESNLAIERRVEAMNRWKLVRAFSWAWKWTNQLLAISS